MKKKGHAWYFHIYLVYLIFGAEASWKQLSRILLILQLHRLHLTKWEVRSRGKIDLHLRWPTRQAQARLALQVPIMEVQSRKSRPLAPLATTGCLIASVFRSTCSMPCTSSRLRRIKPSEQTASTRIIHCQATTNQTRMLPGNFLLILEVVGKPT